MRRFTRRALIVTGLAAGGGLFAGARFLNSDPDGDAATKFGETTPNAFPLNAWIKIAPDDQITLAIHRSEMGQGVVTSLAMILAEELDADWSRISFEFSPLDLDYFNFGLINRGQPFGDTQDRALARFGTDALRALIKTQGYVVTVASTSIIDAYDTLRPAGAAARRMLIQAAAGEWVVDPDRLTTTNGWVIDSTGKQRLSYGALSERAAQFNPPSDVSLKKSSDYRIIGTNPPRLDVGQKVDGSVLFGTDVTLPGMLYATIRHARAFGSKIQSFNSDEVLAMPGVTATTVVDDGAIVVIAESTWQAFNATSRIELETSSGDDISLNSVYQDYRQALDTQEPVILKDQGEVELSDGSSVYEAIYELPFLAHLCMEPMNCTALVTEDRVEIWAPTQAPTYVRQMAALTAGIEEERVIVHSTFLGGGFGRRYASDFVRGSVLAAMEAKGRPVKLTWKREEDVQHDGYRPAAVGRMRATFNEDETITSLSHALVTQSVAEYVLGYGGVGMVAEDLGHEQTGLGATDIPYNIPNQRVDLFPQKSTLVPAWYWRSVANAQNGFFVESFIDELAHEFEADPLEFRRGLLKDRADCLGVLDQIAERGRWNAPLGEGQGRGLSLVDSHGSIVAQVVEVSVTPDRKLTIDRITCVADCRQIIHPIMVSAQIEGAIIDALGATLFGTVSFDQGGVLESNFHDYRLLTMDQLPKLDVHVMAQGGRPGGAGEPGVPGLAPALCNAIYVATDLRVRRLPLSEQGFVYVNS